MKHQEKERKILKNIKKMRKNDRRNNTKLIEETLETNANMRVLNGKCPRESTE